MATGKNTGKVGKGNPPVETRWKEGESGNEKGRPKGRRNFATIYHEAIKKIGESQGKTPEEIEDILHQSGLAKALKGDFNFYRDTMDRLHGKPLQKAELTGAEGGPIEHAHRVVWE